MHLLAEKKQKISGLVALLHTGNVALNVLKKIEI
jgi:hypothetical protein